MAVKTVYRVEGARQLRRTLRAAGDDLSNLRTAHRAAAAIAADAAADAAPVLTGRLKRTVRAAGTKTAGIVRAGNNTSIPYANPIHWGWGRRGIAANPFLSRAARATEPRWLPIYQTAVNTAIAQVKGL
jgi:hypothetical protein